MTRTLVGTNTVIVSQTTGAVTPLVGIPAGQRLIGACCWENSALAPPTVSGITDTKGNTYSAGMIVSAGTGNTTIAVGIFMSDPLTTALTTGDSITVTVSVSRSRWALQWDAFDDLLSVPAPPDQLSQNDNSASSASGTPSTGPTSDLAQNYNLAYAAIGFGVGRTITITPPWQGSASVETAAGSTNRALQVIYQYTGTNAPVTGQIGIVTSSVYAAAMATFPAQAYFPKIRQKRQAVNRASTY
jgi:hypothetical protein